MSNADEIANRYTVTTCGYKDNDCLRDEILEYAKQEAIAFGEFIDSKGFRRERGRKKYKQRTYGNWYIPAAGSGGGEYTMYTNDQIHNLYLQSKQQ